MFLPLLEEDEDQEKTQIKKQLAKGKIKAKSMLLQVTIPIKIQQRHRNYESHSRKYIQIHIYGRVFYNYGNRSVRAMKVTLRKILIAKNNVR